MQQEFIILADPINCCTRNYSWRGMSRKRFRDKITLTVGLLCLACFIVTQSLHSQSMTKGEAFHWAEKWYSQYHNLKSNIGPSQLKLTGSDGRDNIYIAGFNDSGFLIFSNDSQPVLLGYSHDNKLPEDPEHPLYREWLPGFSKQLADANQSGKSFLKSGSPDVPGFDEFVEPLISTQWGQSYPWNKYCPSDEDGHHAPVGCVAVALGQIMKKWDWPAKGRGQNSYIPSAHREYGTVEAVFDTTYYQWDQMYSTEASDASALLLFHVGVGTYMNYAPNESGSNSSVHAANAMSNNFLYNPDMIFREKGSYSYNDWVQLLRQEIVNGRPVFYRGTDPEEGLGHAFNIDGFRDEFFFHFNWGWNGSGDGYYRLEAMVDGGGDFTKGQAALFGIQPNNQPQHDRPFALKAMAGDSFVQLFWDEPLVSSLSHYNIFRDGEQVGSTWETHFRDTAVQNGVTYTYYLLAEYVGDTPGVSLPTPDVNITPWESMTLPYNIDFEDSLAGWQLGESETTFQWKKADSLGFEGNNSKVIGIRSDSAGPGNKVTDYLISPVLDLREMEGAAISFDYVFQQVPHVDYFFLMYRRFDNGLWYPVFRLDSTESWSDWRTHYGYFPDEAKNTLIQLGFFYSDFNGVGKGAAIDNIRIYNVEEKPVPDFDVDTTQICQYNTVIISDSSRGDVLHWSWDFGEGAEPRYSNDQGPHTVTYNTGSKKNVYLMVNHLDHKTKVGFIDVSWETKADFSYDREGLLVSFTNLSDHPQYVFWDFGDSNASTELNPVYQYRSKLEFDVEMVSYSPPCSSDTMRMHLDLRNGTGIEEINFEESIKIYPNPASSYIDVLYLNPDFKPIKIDVINVSGKIDKRINENFSESIRIDVGNLTPGLYWLKIEVGDNFTHKKLIISN